MSDLAVTGTPTPPYQPSVWDALLALYRNASIVAAIDLEGNRIEAADVSWHDLDEALEFAKAALERGRAVTGTPTDLDALRALSDAATPGPWLQGGYDWNADRVFADPDDPGSVIGRSMPTSDAAFIVAAVNKIREMLG